MFQAHPLHLGGDASFLCLPRLKLANLYLEGFLLLENIHHIKYSPREEIMFERAALRYTIPAV